MVKFYNSERNFLLDDEIYEQNKKTYDSSEKNKKLLAALRFKDIEIENERYLSKKRQCSKCHIDGCNGECDEYLHRARLKIKR